MVLEMIGMIGAEIARLTPNTPPAAWLPFTSYAAATIGALIIAASALAIGRSRVAATAAAAAFVATWHMPSSMGLLLFALVLLGVAKLFAAPPPKVAAWVLPLPLFVGFLFPNPGLMGWTFVGIGLAAIAERVSGQGLARRGLRTLIIATLAFIIVAARVPAASTSTPPPQKPLGHDRVTLKSFRALIANIPSGASLVDEDVTTDILMRTAERDLERAHVAVRRVRNNATAVRETLEVRRVFALPFAQRDLSMQGFEIIDSLRTASRGLAEVRPGARCADATHQHQNATTLAGRTELAYAATHDEDRRDPVVLLLGGGLHDEPIRVNPDGWAPRTLRGFTSTTFDLTVAEDARAFRQALADDGQPIAPETLGTRVTRVAMWRMPDAPRFMKISLSHPAGVVYAYLSPEAKASVSVCPVFPVTVSAIR